MEQDEIVRRRVYELFAMTDVFQCAYQAAASLRLEKLTPALLSKAFHGYLVPQDPNDEPASVLLERIRAQPAQEEPAKRERKANGDSGRP